jgi:hypothetical protein
MSELASRIRNVHTHVQGVLSERQSLSAQLTRTEADLRDQQRAAEVLHARIAELERENEVLRSARPSSSVGTERAGTKERIDELVNEIDRCLALLHN